MRSQDLAAFGKVAVLMGGKSAEREISLMSGKNVLEALLRKGVDAHPFDPAERSVFELKREGYARAFIALHGRYGEDGTIQGALEMMEIPYTGSGVMASALCMDKLRTKFVWIAAGLPTPSYEILSADSNWSNVAKTLGLPLIVKPVHEGSTLGLTKVSAAGKIQAAYEYAARYDSLVLAEEFIAGPEFTAAILDGTPLPLIRIEAPHGNYDYHSKYFSDETKYYCPCGLPPAQEHELQALVMRAGELLGLSGWGRADLILRNDGAPFLIEMNTVPGMTAHSLVPMAARAAGIDFDNLVIRILESAHVDKPEILNGLAGVLFTAAFFLAAYGALYYIVRLPIFPLREVRISGDLGHVTLAQVEAIVKREVTGNFFTVDLARTRAAFETLPWVRAAGVRRQWPGQLVIVLEEQVPLARWSGGGLVNAQGEIFAAAHEGKLPLFVGPPTNVKEIAIQYAYFRRSLAVVSQTPVQVRLSPRGAWQIRLESGLTLELGRESIEARIDRFVAFYERTVKRWERGLDYVDLRYPNGFAVRAPRTKTGSGATHRAALGRSVQDL